MNKLWEKLAVGLLGIMVLIGTAMVKGQLETREALAANTVAVRNLQEGVSDLKAQAVPRQEVEARLLDIKTRLTAIETEIARIKASNGLR